jgi:hypothetical protein
MLPKGHKVGTNPVFNGPQKSTAAKVGGAVASGAKVAGSMVAQGAAKAASGVVSATQRVGSVAKSPVVAAKAGVAQVKNDYTKTMNDPRRSGVASTVKSNVSNQPVKGTIKTAAAVTGALAPVAFAKGVASPGNAFRTQQALKSDKADKKSGGLSWTPPKGGAPAAPGARPRPGARP